MAHLGPAFDPRDADPATCTHPEARRFWATAYDAGSPTGRVLWSACGACGAHVGSASFPERSPRQQRAMRAETMRWMQACWAMIARLEALLERHQQRPDVVAVLSAWRSSVQDGVLGMDALNQMQGQLERLERDVQHKEQSG